MLYTSINTLNFNPICSTAYKFILWFRRVATSRNASHIVFYLLGSTTIYHALSYQRSSLGLVGENNGVIWKQRLYYSHSTPVELLGHGIGRRTWYL